MAAPSRLVLEGSVTCLVRRGAGLLGALPLAGTRSWSCGRSNSPGFRVGKVS